MINNIILIGPPASGKGSLAKLIYNDYGIIHISTGDILRYEMELGTKLGISIRETMNSGQYVSDEIITQIVLDTIFKPVYKDGFVLDGFPRTLPQAKILDIWLKNCDVFHLDCPYDILVERMKGRAIKHNRTDDNEEIFKQRYDLYLKEIQPVLDFYAKAGTLKTLDASLPQTEVFFNVALDLLLESVEKTND